MLYELLQLTKITKDTLREVLADFETFFALIAEPSVDGKDLCRHCPQVVEHIPYITFSHENMRVKNIKHNRP